MWARAHWSDRQVSSIRVLRKIEKQQKKQTGKKAIQIFAEVFKKLNEAQ